MRRLVPLLLILLAACTDGARPGVAPPPATAPPPGAPPPAVVPYKGPVRHPLEGALRQGVPADLVVLYTDMHGMHGGETLVIKGSGEASMERRKHGGSPLETRTLRLARPDMERLIALLIEVEVWQQREPERTPVPDESRAQVRVQAGGVEGGFWEWYNDMGERKRLGRIKELMESLIHP